MAGMSTEEYINSLKARIGELERELLKATKVMGVGDLEAENQRLKAQMESLTRAGDSK